MKVFKKLLCFMAVITFGVIFCSTNSLAATKGDQLITSEEGWQRIDDVNSMIVGTGGFVSQQDPSNVIGNTTRQSQNVGDSITFKFYGSKFRLMGTNNTNRSSNIQVAVDGVNNGTFSQNSSPLNYVIDYEVTNLVKGYHTVKITLMESPWYCFDGIDIDGDGFLVDINNPTPPPSSNGAILEVTMTNGNIKEYYLTATELSDFLTWYDGKENGVGKSYYVFTKKSNIKPFLSRKEYIAYKKISSFEVKEYNE